MERRMLCCEDLACLRGDRPVFAQLGVCIPTGTVLGIVGDNGSGKTSLLRILAGIAPAAAGHVAWKGVPIAQHEEFQRIVQYVGHRGALKPAWSVEENILFWAALRGDTTLVRAALHYFDLERLAAVPLAELSAGWQRRVALARLVAIPAQIWLLDEPYANLDAHGVALLRTLIETRAKQGGIVIFTLPHRSLDAPAHAYVHLADFALHNRTGICAEDMSDAWESSTCPQRSEAV